MSYLARLKWPNGEGQGYSRLYKFVVPRSVRSWGGYRHWAIGHMGRGAMRSRAYRVRRYWINVKRDIEARALGYCNHAPWPKQGGYSHWRCARLRAVCATAEEHRSNNYVWSRTSGKRVVYAPVEGEAATLSRPYRDRYMQRNMRQEIRWRFWMARARRSRRANDGA